MTLPRNAAPFALFLLAAGCATPAPTTMGGCAALGEAAARETCRYEMLLPTVSTGRLDAETLDAGLLEIADDTSRDLVLLRLAIAAPKQASALCARVRTAGAQEKCQQVLGRPHLGTERRAPRPPPTGTPPARSP